MKYAFHSLLLTAFALVVFHDIAQAELRVSRRGCAPRFGGGVRYRCAPLPTCYRVAPCPVAKTCIPAAPAYAPLPIEPAPCCQLPQASIQSDSLRTAPAYCPKYLAGKVGDLWLYYGVEWNWNGSMGVCGSASQPLYYEDSDFTSLPPPQMPSCPTTGGPSGPSGEHWCIPTGAHAIGRRKDKGCEKGHKLKENEFPPVIDGVLHEVGDFSFEAKYTLQPSGDVVHVRCYKYNFTFDGMTFPMYLGYEHPKDTNYAQGPGTVACKGKRCFELEATINSETVKYLVLLDRGQNHKCE